MSKLLSEKLVSQVAFRLAFGGLTLGALAASETLFSESTVSEGRLPPELLAALAPLGWLALLVFASSLFVLLFVRLGYANPLLAWVQVAADLVMAGVVLVRGGGAESPFSLLLGVIVASSAISLGRRDVLITAAAASAMLIGVAAHGSDTPARAMVHALTQVAAFFAVAWLASAFGIETARSDSKRLSAEHRLRLSEHFYERVLSSLSSGVIIADAQGRIAFANSVAADICGFEPAPLLPLLQVAPELSAAADSDRGECVLHGKNGERTIGYSQVWLQDQGQLLARTLVFRDLTHIRAMEVHAAQSEKLAAVGRLAAGIAHELRNPLGAVSGAIEMVAASEALSAPDKELLALATKETTRLNTLIEDFLEFARPRAPERVSSDLRILVQETVAMIARDTKLSGRDIAINGEAARLQLDPNQFKQVFWNLLKNACEATTAGQSVQVSISNGDAVRIAIADSGKGLSADEAARLFEPFFTTKSKGTGLGLAVVRQIVEAHGGQVSARAGKEHGMVFEIVLPKDDT